MAVGGAISSLMCTAIHRLRAYAPSKDRRNGRNAFDGGPALSAAARWGGLGGGPGTRCVVGARASVEEPGDRARPIGWHATMAGGVEGRRDTTGFFDGGEAGAGKRDFVEIHRCFREWKARRLLASGNS